MASPNAEELEEERVDRIRRINNQITELTAENITMKKFLAIYDHAVPEPEKIDRKMDKYHELFVNFDEMMEDL